MAGCIEETCEDTINTTESLEAFYLWRRVLVRVRVFEARFCERRRAVKVMRNPIV